MSETITTDVWEGCYDDSWKGFIVDEAFSHPAKFSRGLIARIFLEMQINGWLKKGDTVVDPFGGIGCGGVVAAGLGYRWVGVELESKFHLLGQQNFAMHAETWRQFGDPLPVLVNGDSRKLRENLRGVLADVVASSPPFTERLHVMSADLMRSKKEYESAGLANRRQGNSTAATERQVAKSASVNYGDTPGQLGAMKPGVLADAVACSPPFASALAGEPRNTEHASVLAQQQRGENNTRGGSFGKSLNQDYGQTPGQLGAMKPGSVDAVCTSPPYAGCHVGNEGGDNNNLFAKDVDDKAKYGRNYSQETPGQLGALPPGQVDSVITSPPYAECLQGDNTARETAEESRAKRKTEGGSLGQSCRHSGYGSKENLGNLPAGAVDAIASSPTFVECNVNIGDVGDTPAMRQEISATSKPRPESYGGTVGQLGNDNVETFWAAAKAICIECHAILKPGGMSAWVCKDFIRNKQRVPFCDDWCKLLEACGFTVVKRVHAMLVKEQRARDLFGGDDHVEKTERKSFFRRLYEKKFPANSIDFEVVIFARKDTEAAQ